MAARKRKEHKRIERPKTRKELRKDKRLQKKANRVFYHKKKKELKIEYRARLKQQRSGKFDNSAKNQTHKEVDLHDQVDEDGLEEEDDVIASDFELSDEELEKKFQKKSPLKPKVKLKQPGPDRFQQDLQREKQKQKQLEREMRKQRVRQLKAANEDEDKMIRKLEKQLKIDKTRSQKHVPKMFNDGLEYALELCLPENIQKMYTAAKEAAEQDEDSDNGFQEDMALALGTNLQNNKRKRNDPQSNAPRKKMANIDRETETSATVQRQNKKMAALRKIESKYFDTDDEIDSDLSGNDSEYEHDSSDGDVVEVRNNKSTRNTPVQDSVVSEVEDDTDETDVASNSSLDEFDESDPQGLKSSGQFVKKPASDSEEELNEQDSKKDKNSNGTAENIAKLDSWEDIYGRNRDNQGNVIVVGADNPSMAETTKYVPPHVRARLAAAAATGNDEDPRRREKLERLKKQLKGYLNRLSEANMHRIAADVESVYMQNSRFDVNNTLTQLMFDGLVSHTLSPERMVLEHTMLIAVLHANVGSEVGAHFLQTCIEQFHNKLGRIEEFDVENKELDNVILIICHMYTFKIFQHNLIYEILSKLTETLGEKTVECILLALKSIGFSLRKDDPIALKELISVLHKKAVDVPEAFRNNSRLKYMLDVLLAIKNNNVNKIPQYDPTLAEHLRKILRTLLVNGKYVTTLNITLEDLLRADQRGKWWVVGSAWSGNVNDIGVAAEKVAKSSQQHAESTTFSATILELARKQRMNTDDRKNVFCILMTASDYIEAFEKLHHLAIKDHKIIVTVIIHCCLSEKIFNPYYAVLTQKFCDFNRKYQLAAQFALWDRIKDIKSQANIQIKNLAQFVAHLIEHGGLALSVLKVVEFGELDKVTLRLVRQIMLALLMGSESTCKQVFQRIAPSAQLKSFKDSIRLFMHHFLLKGGSKSGIGDDQMDLLQQRIRIADKALETLASRIQF